MLGLIPRHIHKDNLAFIPLQIAAHSAPNLVEEMLHPAALDLCAQYSEEISEMTSQLQKQVARIRELRTIKEEEKAHEQGSRLRHRTSGGYTLFRSALIRLTDSHTSIPITSPPCPYCIPFSGRMMQRQADCIMASGDLGRRISSDRGASAALQATKATRNGAVKLPQRKRGEAKHTC